MENQNFTVKANYVQYALLFLFFLSPLINYAQLGKYEFTGVSTIDRQFNDVTTQPENAIFSTFKREIALWVRGDNVFNSRYWQSPTNNQDAYIEFTITAQPGAYLNLTQLVFRGYRTTDGPAKIRITHNGTGSFAEAKEFEPLIGTYKNFEWDFNDVVTPGGGAVTFRIYGTESTQSLGAFRVDDVALYGSANKLAVNEFHYANTASSKTGFIEILASKDLAQLNNVTVSLYNSTGTVYSSYPLTTFKSEVNAVYGNDRIYYLDIPSGLVDEKGGISLSSGNNVIQFLSYGGTLTATDGPAMGQTSKNVGISESAADGDNNSIYLTQVDNRGIMTPIWTKGTTDTNTKGFANWEQNQTLPVELVYFRAQAGSKGVNLSWATASEQNNEKFLLERSLFQTADFKTVATIKGAGTTQQEQQYRFMDEKSLTGTTYYRLKQIDFDGTTTYSPIVAVQPKKLELKLALYPNPVSEQIYFEMGNTSETGEVEVQIVNTTGRIVYKKDLKAVHGYQVTVSDLPSGTYYLMVTRNGKKETKSFIKI